MRDRPTVRISKRRCGTANGQAKLTDAQVLQLRIDRVMSKKRPDFKELGTRYGISTKQARNICQGRSRIEAGGPIESAAPAAESSPKRSKSRGPFYKLKPPIRCVVCRYMAFPSKADPTRCYGCVVSAAA